MHWQRLGPAEKGPSSASPGNFAEAYANWQRLGPAEKGGLPQPCCGGRRGLFQSSKRAGSVSAVGQITGPGVACRTRRLGGTSRMSHRQADQLAQPLAPARRTDGLLCATDQSLKLLVAPATDEFIDWHRRRSPRAIGPRAPRGHLPTHLAGGGDTSGHLFYDTLGTAERSRAAVEGVMGRAVVSRAHWVRLLPTRAQPLPGHIP